MKIKIILSLAALFFHLEVYCSEARFTADLLKTTQLILQGSIEQFKTENNLYYAGAAVPSIWYSFNEDKKVFSNAVKRDRPSYMDLAGDLGVILSFPIIPILAYSIGNHQNNRKVVNFSMEYAASLYLSLIETGLLSHIPIHERPNSENLNFWEKTFRGKSSFTSGHIVPFATLFFKTLQFYGPYYALAPLVLTTVASLQRIRQGRHYLSDIVGGFFLSAFASEGVRAAANNKNNHIVYKILFKHQAQIGFIRYKNTYGPRLSFNF